jgi:hypothetical protein
MTIWTIMRTGTNIRFVLPVLQELIARGDRVHVSLSFPVAAEDDRRGLAELRRVLPQVQIEPFDTRDASAVRRAYRHFVALPARELRSFVEQSPSWPIIRLQRPLRLLVRLARTRRLERLHLRGLVAQASRLVERTCPVPSGVLEAMRRIQPDVVFVTPMIYPGTHEIEAVKAAAVLGAPAVGMVLSWDNLSSKGSFHAVPDRVIVWNEAQVAEAERYHRLDSARVVPVGAPVFDYLFDESLRADRKAFLREFGLAPSDRYVLYAVSSRATFGPGREAGIVHELAGALEEECPVPPFVLVRPHPKNRAGWERFRHDRVVIDHEPGFPDDGERRGRLYNSLFHSQCVVGLNTSVFLEASVVGVPCVAIEFPASHPASVVSSYPHFAHVRDAGFVHLAHGTEDAARIIGSLRTDDERAAAQRRFVQSFIRPHGLDRPAAECAVDVISGAKVSERT